MSLTGRYAQDHRILAAIDRHWRDYGKGPRVADLADVIGRANTSTYVRLLRLGREGFITWAPRQTGTLRVVQP